MATIRAWTSVASVLLFLLRTDVALAVRKSKLLSDQLSQVNARRISNGDDVTLTDIESRQIPNFTKATPFPAFVALTWQCAKGAQLSVSQCGGTLYKKRYILTAAHCLTNFETCTDFEAYLNPYRNPFVLKVASRFLVGSFREKFEEDTTHGLGVKLPGVKATFKHQAWAKEYQQVGEKAEDDIGVIQLVEPPSLPDSAWKIIEDYAPFTSSKRSDDGVTAVIYGNGDSHSRCLGVSDISCIIQQKAVHTLSHRDCMRAYIDVAQYYAETVASPLRRWRMVSWLLRLSSDMRTLLDSSEKLTRALEARSKVWEEYWKQDNHEASNLQAASAQADAQFEVAFEALKELAPLSPTFSSLTLGGVLKGKQLCILSPTGVQRPGDSGGPMVSSSKQLLGISSCGGNQHSALGHVLTEVLDSKSGEQRTSGRWTSEGRTDTMWLPGFYMATSFYKDEIEELVRCLTTQESANDRSPPTCTFASVKESTGGAQDEGYLSRIGQTLSGAFR